VVIEHRTLDVRGLRMHIAEAGSGPLVVLLHGFPESWYSWRHQLMALADAGYHVVAPDQRGYGGTDAPNEIEAYSVLHLVGDVIGLLDALGEPAAVVVGHDWGAPVAWHTALLRPDRVRGVAGLSVPFRPRGSRRPTEVMREAFGDRYYMIYFQEPGVADTELNRDPRRSLRRFLYSASGEAPQQAPIMPPGGGFLDYTSDSDQLPPWLSEADLDVFVADYAKSGFTGGLNWYRNLDRSWSLMAAWHRVPILPPALYVAGERDLVVNQPGTREYLPTMIDSVPNLRRSVLLPGCGHWTQQERPAEVNAELLEFLASLPGA
jgi:pimeloyl-ACP methyl ester carboxylesterase